MPAIPFIPLFCRTTMFVGAFLPLLLASGSLHVASKHVRRTGLEGLLTSMKRHHHVKPRVPFTPSDDNDKWTFLGCYAYYGTNTLFQNISNSSSVGNLESCQSICLSKGFKYAGLGNGQQCQCSNDIVKDSIPASIHSENDCDAPGGGNGRSLLSLYGQTAFLPTHWSRLGCFTDTGNPPALDGFSTTCGFNSPLTCSALCAGMGYNFSGVENGNKCFCGNSVAWTGGSGQPAPDGECATPCSAFGIGTCGGNNRIEIYASPSYSSSSSWQLKENYHGQNFFDDWTFYDKPDPTHGVVTYSDASKSWELGLVSINEAGNAIMKVDTTPTVPLNRNSVRIQTNMEYNGGLVILDAVHMPVACGAWPAFWSVGNPTWPIDGEMDIVEGVDYATQNKMSVHTGPGCTIPADFGGTGTLSQPPPNGTNCDAYATQNTGCSIDDSGPNTFGEGYNSIGGGVHIMIWDNTSGGNGITMWFFPRGGIPFDISTNEPQPSGWGTPQARWPAATCNPSDFFKDHVLVFDTTLCGDWAGASSVWNSTNQNGQTGGSCASRTGYSTCVDFVRGQGAAFAEAYWEVGSVKFYQ